MRPSIGCYSGPMVIEGVELLNVESDSTLTPIEGAPAPQRLDDRKPDTEPYPKERRETDVVIGWGNVDCRIVRIRPRPVDGRAIERGIYEFRIGRLDDNSLPFG